MHVGGRLVTQLYVTTLYTEKRRVPAVSPARSSGQTFAKNDEQKFCLSVHCHTLELFEAGCEVVQGRTTLTLLSALLLYSMRWKMPRSKQK